MAAKVKAPRVRKRTIAELEAELVKRTAERDEALAREVKRTAERNEAQAQQIAIGEVLQIINSSSGDPVSVFDAILEKAHTLCRADRGALVTFDGEMFRAAATRGLPEPFVEFLRKGFPLIPGSPPERLVRGERLVHILDMAALAAENPEFASVARPALDLAGARTLLLVPLRRDNVLLGYIAAMRQEVRRFTDKQIALL